MNEGFSGRSPSTRVYIWATAILVVLLGASIVFYAIGSHPSTTNKNLQNAATNTVTNTAVRSTDTPPVAPEPAVVTSRSGTITRILRSSFRFQTPVYNIVTQTYEQKEITAEYTSQTLFSEIDRRGFLAPPVPGQPSAAPEKKLIAATDLKVGDIVNVYAASDIKSSDSFTATEVNRLLIQ